MGPSDDLSLNSWAVLTLLVDDGPQHGFALARQLTRTSDIGRVWAVSRPLVYRALDQLEGRGYVVAGPETPSPTGPARQERAATPAGVEAATRWRTAPVHRLRDVRPTLILKLTLCARAGVDPGPLVAAQRAALAPVLAELRRRDEHEPPPVVDIWRQELADAVLRTLDRVDPSGPGPA